MEDRYWIALFKEGGESAGVERELAREHVLNIAQSKYKQSAAMYPNRIVMLCDRATVVLARSDRNPPYTAMRRAG
jgi:predicted house-cleaning NTP pyrophosphatase (Maf/HAM1 superfamily)